MKLRVLLLGAALAAAALAAIAVLVLPSHAERDFDRAEREGRWILLILDEGEVQTASRADPKWRPYADAAGLGVEDWYTATTEIAAYTSEFGGTVLNVLDESGRRQITASPGRTVECPAILPDGSVVWQEGYLAIGVDPKELKILRPRSQTADSIALPMSLTYTHCLATAGNRVAWRGTDFAMHVAELRNGALESHRAFAGPYATGINGILSPDGKSIYYDFADEVRAVSVDTGQDRVIVEGISISELVAVSPDGRWIAADPLEQTSFIERVRTSDRFRDSPLLAIRVSDGAVVDLGIASADHARWITEPPRE